MRINKRIKLAILIGIVAFDLCSVSFAQASQHAKRRIQKVELPPLPSGTIGPIPQIPLDAIAPVPPQVTYQNGRLTIVSTNSTLRDILLLVHDQTGAQVDADGANDRVVTHLGPGPPRDVLAKLLEGSRFDYVLLGSPTDFVQLTRVVLVPKAEDNREIKEPTSIQPATSNQPAHSQAENKPDSPVIQPTQESEEPQGMLETPEDPR